jgi:4-amino-4-deoxy-L-arabinose transferase-like glycosyltransferase
MNRRRDVPGTRESGGLLLLLVLALLAIVWAADVGRPRMLGWDESEYAGIGRGLLHGEGYRTYGNPEPMRLPMVPMLVAATLTVAPHGGDHALRWTGLLCMVVALLVTYRGVAYASDRTTAFAATLFFGALPMTRVLATVVLSEAPFLACFTAAVWWLHEALGGRSRAYLASAAAFGLALLARYDAALLAPIALLLALIRGTTIGPRELARRTIGSRDFWLAPLVTLAVLAPWLVREIVLFHDPLLGLHQSSEIVILGHWGAAPWWWYLKRLPLTAGWPALIAAVLGLGMAVRDRGGAAMTALVVCVVVMAGHSGYLHKEDRYICSMMPFVATLAAFGVTGVLGPWLGARAGAAAGERSKLRWLGPWFTRWLTARVAATVTATLVVATGAAILADDTTRRITLDPYGYPALVEAMETVRAESPPDRIVIGASGPQIHWYADRPTRQFPEDVGDLSDMLPRASWVVFVNFERMQPQWATDLTRLFTEADVARGDVRVYHSGPFQTVIVRAPLLASRIDEASSDGP